MRLFFKKKKLSSEDIEKEYEKEQRTIRSERMLSLERAIERYAEKTCFLQKGDDVLAKKAEFIRFYSFRARMNRYYYSLNHKKGKFNSVPLWCQKWQNYEQDRRFIAQKRWREMMSKTR